MSCRFCKCNKKVQGPFVLTGTYTVQTVSNSLEDLCWEAHYDHEVAADVDESCSSFSRADKLELYIKHGERSKVHGAFYSNTGRRSSSSWAKDSTGKWVDSYKITSLNLSKDRVEDGWGFCLRVSKGIRPVDLMPTDRKGVTPVSG